MLNPRRSSTSTSSRYCPSLRQSTKRLLVSFLALSAVCEPVQAVLRGAEGAAIHPVLPVLPPELGGGDSRGSGPGGEGEMKFSLRHVLHHGAHKYPKMLRRLDVHPDDEFWVESEGGPRSSIPKLKASARTKPIKRLKDRSRETVERHIMMARQNMVVEQSEEAWTRDLISQPDVTDRDTVISLAKMTADAYVDIPGTGDWLDVGTPWNVSSDFGWDSDGLRGHVFVDEKNTTLVIGLKGTSTAIFEGPETTGNDKVNDNLLFSCCCARISYWWKTVCDCFSGTPYTCNQTCISDALMDENKYYVASRNLYYNITSMYPHITNVWLVGHSLGGALSSLLGQTFGVPAVGFQAPGESMAAGRLYLPAPSHKTKPTPPNKYASEELAVYHFGHTADPIFMGTCNGATSGCAIAGYALESGCHSGSECVYDVVNEKKWRVNVAYHRIQVVIKDILEKYDTVPECKAEPDCVDCFNWRFLEGNETLPTTTTTTTTATATTTCISKGWWGCLDPTTTTTPGEGESSTTTTSKTSTSTSKTTSVPTTTCTSYGWFGNCLDDITSEPTPVPTTTPTTTCKTMGWFGCLDDVTSEPTPDPTATASSTTTTTCKTMGWFGCLDDTTSTTKHHSKTTASSATTTTCLTPGWFGCHDSPTETSAPSSPTPTAKPCEHYGWFGGCLDPTTTTTKTRETKTTETVKPTQTGSHDPKGGRKCGWFSRLIGYCKEDADLDNGPGFRDPGEGEELWDDL